MYTYVYRYRIGEGDLDHSKTISYEEFKKLMHTAS